MMVYDGDWTATYDPFTAGSPTEYIPSWTWTTTLDVEPEDKKHQKVVENAIKATETMVQLGKRYIERFNKIVYIPIYKVVRSLFCKSGYLPKRIRAIRKSK